VLELDVAYLCIKFDHYSFNRSGVIVAALQNLNGSRDLTTPLSGMIVICGLALTTTNLSI